MLVYKITNKINNQAYIGVTSNTLETRWYQHVFDATTEGRSCYNGKFQRAIRKYGSKNFDHEVLENGIEDKELLYEREQYYINLYNSYHNGYNSTIGGEYPNLELISKKVYQLDKDGNIINTFNSINEAARLTEASGPQICLVCNNKANSSGGFGWCFIEDYKKEEQKIREVNYKVIQYSYKGEFIKIYNNGEDASKETKIDRGDISRVIQGKRNHAGNFIWRKYEDNYPLQVEVPKLKLKYNKVIQYDLQENKIAEFETVQDAEIQTGINANTINKVCRGDRKTAGGFKWAKEYVS